MVHLCTFPSCQDMFIQNTTYYKVCRLDLMNIQDVYFLSLPVRSQTSNCLVPISFTTLKFGTYFAFQIDFLSQFFIIIKSPILNLGMFLCLSCFCLECASLALRAVSIFVCYNLLGWVLPSSEPKYLNLGCKKLEDVVNMGHI